jgi:hypothetical protein
MSLTWVEKASEINKKRNREYTANKKAACRIGGKSLGGVKDKFHDLFLIKAKGGLTILCDHCRGSVLKDCSFGITMYNKSLVKLICRDCITVLSPLYDKSKSYQCPKNGACQALHITKGVVTLD